MYIGMAALGVLAVYIAGLAVVAIGSALRGQVLGVPIYLSLSEVLACLGGGAIIFVYRENRHRRWTAWLQIVIALVGGWIAFFYPVADSRDIWVLARWVGFGAAVLAVADGFVQLQKAVSASRKR